MSVQLTDNLTDDLADSRLSISPLPRLAPPRNRKTLGSLKPANGDTRLAIAENLPTSSLATPLVRNIAKPAIEEDASGNDAQRVQLPRADLMAATMVRQSVEVLLGRRPPRQVQAWMDPPIHARLVKRYGLRATHNARTEKSMGVKIMRVIVSQSNEHTAYASLVVFEGTKVRAACVKLEVRRGRWFLTGLDIL